VQVKVRVSRGPLVEILGKQEIIVEYKGQTKVIDVLRILANDYGKSFKDKVFDPETGEIKPYFVLALNGVGLNGKKGIETEIKDGSELLILSPTGGG
jgi:molybdopterin converting factor small subunit